MKLAVTIALIAFSAASTAAENLNLEGMKAYEKGKIPEARKLFVEALGQARKSNADVVQQARILNNLGFLDLNDQEFETAEKYLLEAIKDFRGANQLDPTADHFVDAVNCLETLGRLYWRKGKFDEAEPLLKESFSLQKSSNKFDEKFIAVRTENLRNFYSQLGVDAIPNPNGPELSIVRPRPGEVFKNEPIVVRVDVTNYKLEQPEPRYGTAVHTGIGHIHYLLDDHPPIATHSTQIMIEGGPAFLKPGEHTILIELVDERHNPLTPPVRHRVKFQTTK